jgi:CubicO group peptidase (beta-lactamase class C family)
MQQIRLLVGLVTLLTLVGATAAAAVDPLATDIDAVFADYDTTNSPGCALGVIRSGELIYKRGYGMANLEYGIALSPRSVFRTGSVGKQFTAMAIALLAEEGIISLDDSIRKLFPELPAYADEITIRHLIHHTSGIRDYLELAFMAGLDDEGPYTDKYAIELIARQKNTNFAPGEEFSPFTRGQTGYGPDPEGLGSREHLWPTGHEGHPLPR